MAKLITKTFYTVQQVAATFTLSTRTVRRLIAKGELVAHRFGTSIRIADDELRAYAARRRDA